MIRGFPYVRQNHVVLPKSFPTGRINTHGLVHLGYNWFYEHNLSNRNYNFLSASTSPIFASFLPSPQMHTPSVMTTLRPAAHSLFTVPPSVPSHSVIIPVFATSVFLYPCIFTSPSSFFSPCSYPFIPPSLNPTLLLASFYTYFPLPQTSKTQVMHLELCVLL